MCGGVSRIEWSLTFLVELGCEMALGKNLEGRDDISTLMLNDR